MERQPQGAAAAVSVAVRKPRYERQVASDRREALVDATIESLKRWGQEGLSVRRIAAEAGVSIGLINHHFPNKDTLVAESYRAFSRRLAASFEAAVAAAGPDPRARLKAYFNAFFSRPNLDPQVLTAWLVYWSRVQVSPEMHAVHEEEGRGYGELLERLLSDLAEERGRAQPDLKIAVTGLTALLDGLWLKCCLDPSSFRPKDAAALCDDWVDRVIGPRTAR
jgi:TetR/AcrR family transcriptional repressor of bet genes